MAGPAGLRGCGHSSSGPLMSNACEISFEASIVPEGPQHTSNGTSKVLCRGDGDGNWTFGALDIR